MIVNHIDISSTQNLGNDLWQLCMATEKCPHPGRDFPKIEPLSHELQLLDKLKNKLTQNWLQMDDQTEIDLNLFATNFVSQSGKEFRNVEAKVEFEEEVKIAVQDNMWGKTFILFLGRGGMSVSPGYQFHFLYFYHKRSLPASASS